ncbi:cellulase family glycosylhydrolase [Pseudozobellia thermophila]|uniref:mannan endo-1,4-beta-mannosidase n=1 Tax=Pseudozobellia thermophila TaxID=192903 RepID=A0A1M6I273_9FLAO|nr:cellulase family glycosylhydrolase [Pseudozobellia thermophila]SHJ28546.1 Cellulase (glycosyl hydrolase family 5) [Pseudozobellia thermophila]
MDWNRLLIRAVLIASFLGMNALIVFGISSVWSYLNTGADRSTRLHLNLEEVTAYLPKVEWDTSKVEGRPMEAQTLAQIERDYLHGWYVRNTALFDNNRYGIADYFTEGARAKIFGLLDFNRKQNASFKQTTLSHRPELAFYSADGTQVYFTDRKVELYQRAYENGSPLFESVETTGYKVIMLLEDGFWRTRHFTKIPSSDKVVGAPVRLSNGTLGAIRNIKGVNYYPQDTPWDVFGKKYDEAIIAKDFELIRHMGWNTIRIFIPYEDFGAVHVDGQKLAKVRSLLDRADQNGLKVMVTLFDFYGNYDVLDWTLTHRHAEQVVKALKDHPALLAWDLKNEPDLDFGSRGEQTVLAWLREMNRQVRNWDQENAITVGWASPEAAVHLNDELDFVSFHYYREVSEFKEAYNTLKASVAEVGKPIVLQEYGISSYGGIWNAFGASEEKQADYYKEMQGILKEEGLPFLFWTLYDFNQVPNSVVGWRPWRKQPQRYYGCFDKKGEPKAALDYLRQTE